MRLLVLVLALVGCADSTEERLDQFKAEADVVCWEYDECLNIGSGPARSPPAVPIEQGLACMNDALASGARVMAAWGVDDFYSYTTTRTYVFIIDHQVKVFESYRHGENPATLRELTGCTGPLRIDDRAVCFAADSPSHTTPVKVLAWDGCP